MINLHKKLIGEVPMTYEKGGGKGGKGSAGAFLFQSQLNKIVSQVAKNQQALSLGGALSASTFDPLLAAGTSYAAKKVSEQQATNIMQKGLIAKQAEMDPLDIFGGRSGQAAINQAEAQKAQAQEDAQIQRDAIAQQKDIEEKRIAAIEKETARQQEITRKAEEKIAKKEAEEKKVKEERKVRLARRNPTLYGSQRGVLKDKETTGSLLA